MTYPQISNEQSKTIQAVIETSLGDITLELYPEIAPKTVENFVTHAKNGYYNGVIFHRVIPDFMIQTGDPTGTGRGGESIWGSPFADEFSPELVHVYGALSMANAGPHTNGSQFFIVTSSRLAPQMAAQLEPAGYPKELVDVYTEKGGTPWLDGKHTVFGQVVSGMDVAEKIAKAERDLTDKPLEDIVIKGIDIQE